MSTTMVQRIASETETLSPLVVPCDDGDTEIFWPRATFATDCTTSIGTTINEVAEMTGLDEDLFLEAERNGQPVVCCCVPAGA